MRRNGIDEPRTYDLVLLHPILHLSVCRVYVLPDFCVRSFTGYIIPNMIDFIQPLIVSASRHRRIRSPKYPRRQPFTLTCRRRALQFADAVLDVANKPEVVERAS